MLQPAPWLQSFLGVHCVQLIGCQKQYPKEAWDDLQKFLSSSTGRAAINATQCRGFVGVVFLALNTLKNEKIMPTEPNIADCIKYGDSKHRNTDIKKAFTSAVEQQLVVMQTLGALQLYVEKNKNLWRCVNPIDGNLKQYPKEAWDDLQNFLSSSAGRHSASNGFSFSLGFYWIMVDVWGTF
ncbi:hypothetical protein P3L10_011641 [Capsicum annuum]